MTRETFFNTLSFLFIACCLISCACLTKSQLKEVNAFGTLTKDFSATPGKIFSTYNDVEVQKQLFLTNAIQNADMHLASIDEFYKNQNKKSKLNAQADAAMQVLNDYGQKLAHLAADVHSKELDTAALSAGKNLDGLITSYNTLLPAHKIPTGIGAFVGQALSATGDIYIQHKQAMAVKEFVIRGDVLVTNIVAAINESLDASGDLSFKALLENEKTDLRKNYRLFRKRAQEEVKIFPINLKTRKADTLMSHIGQVDAWHSGGLDADRLYLQCLANLDTDEQLRLKCIAAADTLLKAHHQMLADLQERKKIKDFYATLQGYAGSVSELYATFKKIK